MHLGVESHFEPYLLSIQTLLSAQAVLHVFILLLNTHADRTHEVLEVAASVQAACPVAWRDVFCTHITGIVFYKSKMPGKLSFFK